MNLIFLKMCILTCIARQDAESGWAVKEVSSMTYYQLITELKNCALEEPNVRFAGSKDIFELNSLPDIDYTVFYITPNQHQMNSDTIKYSLNLYYIDR